ncbi:MAG: response regulator, partial [Candidatus Electryoneaceae bacterium]|nr:response regulator [Candidatus Electryoneaceae bacterium]
MIVNEAGRPIGVEGVLRDINDRKLAEDELRKLSRAVEQSPASIVITNTDGVIEYVNPKFIELTGYSLEEAIGQNPSILKSGLQIDDYYQELWDTILRGEVWRGEFCNKKKNGDFYWESASISPVINDQDETTHYIAVKEDITDRKQAELELQQAKEEAESANRAKSDFLANMSHEIRTPMNGVIGMADLLMDTELTPEQLEFTQTIRRSADSLLTVINEILDFSKIEAGKMELEAIDFDLRTTMEYITDITANKASHKGLEFVSIISPDVPSLLIGDPGRLRQILINLIGNAIKFTSKGEVVVKVDLDHETDSDVTVRFSVTDTGIGIPADKINSLFESFTQVDSSTTRRYGGTGLGLVISKRLVEMMNGQIGVDSVEEEGSTFWFTALLRKQPIDPDHPLDGESTLIEEGDIRGKHILIVDDNDTNRLLLRELLQGWHCRYDEATEGETALEKMRQAAEQNDPFEVALLDMLMPEMDGEMLGKKIKADPSIRDTVLVILTSLERSGDLSRFEAIGFTAYLTKPIKQSQLFDCLVTIFHPNNRPVKAKSSGAIVTKHTIDGDRRRKVRILVVEDNPTNQLVARAILKKLGYTPDLASNGLEAVEEIEKVSYGLVLMDVQMPVMDGYEATHAI